MNPAELNLFFEPKDRLRLTVGSDRSYPTVKPVWAAPLSQPSRYLALLDGKGDEIVTVDDLETLNAASQEAVRQELARRYLTSTIQAIDTARTEFGATYWQVQTERGEREFVTQSLQENAMWLTPRHLLLVDVDGNRFEVPNVDDLDDRSRSLVESIL